MLRRATLFALLVTAAFPAAAAERPRLVLGGIDGGLPAFRLDGGETRADLASLGATRIGALVESTPSLAAGGRDRLALGGYVAYDLNEYRFSSSLRTGDLGMAADLAASTEVPGLGLACITQLRLGADWARPQSFSLNAAQPGLAGFEGYRPGGDLSLSLSWSRDVTPSLSLGGMAAATRPMATEYQHGGFVLGAGLGYRF